MADTPSTNSPSTVFGANKSIGADDSKQETDLSIAISEVGGRIQRTLDLNKRARQEFQKWEASRNYPKEYAIGTVAEANRISRYDNALEEMKGELGENGLTMEDIDAAEFASVLKSRLWR